MGSGIINLSSLKQGNNLNLDDNNVLNSNKNEAPVYINRSKTMQEQPKFVPGIFQT